MMKFMKILCLAVILAITLLFSLLSCSDSNNDQGDTTSSAENDVTGDSTSSTAEVPEFVPAVEDYDGYIFKMLGYDSYAGSWRAAEVSEIYAAEESGEPINDAVYRRNRIVEDLYNIEIGLVPLSYGDRGSHSGIALRSILAGDDAYDAALTIGTSLPPILGNNDNTIDLFDVPGLDLSLSWWDQNSVSDLSIAKELHVVTGDITLYSAFASGMFYANKPLITDYDLQNPYELVHENKWNWDSVYSMAKAVTVDVNGDGVMDITVDQYGIGAENMCAGITVRGAGERITKKDADDIPYLAVNTERTIQALDKVYEVVFNNDIAINGNELVGYPSQYFNFFLPKFNENRILFLYHALFTSLNMRDMESDFCILPPPMLDETQERYYSCINETWGTYMWIPATNRDHERTGNILQALGYYSQQFVTPAFWDVTVTNKVIRDEDSSEMLEIILNSRTYDMGIIYNWNDLENKFFRNAIRNRTNSFVSDYEKNELSVKTTMEKTLNEILGK